MPPTDPTLPPAGHRMRVVVLWTVMTMFTSSAAILTRYTLIPAGSIGFWRTFGAGLLLSPLFVLTARRTGVTGGTMVTRGSLLTGLFLGVHFATWAWALLHSHVANAALFIALQPAITPLLGHWVNRDKLTRWEYVGTALACGGMLWVIWRQVAVGSDQLAGSMVALFSMVCCAIYLVLGRRYRANQPVWLFVVPVYLAAAAAQAVLAVLFDGGIRAPATPGATAAVLGLVLLPTVGGHTLALYLLRHTKAHTVAMSVPVQFMIVSAAAMVLFEETPSAYFYTGAAMVLAGVILAIGASTRRPTVAATADVPPGDPDPQVPGPARG